MSESIVGLAINKRQAFHFSIHEMISPRGLLGTLQEVSGDIAGASAMHTHPLFAETLSWDDDYEVQKMTMVMMIVIIFISIAHVFIMCTPLFY